MVAINKQEKEAIVSRFPNIGIVRTVKQKSKRHHYYMEERRDAMAYLRKLRGEVPANDYRNNRNKRYDGARKNNFGAQNFNKRERERYSAQVSE